MKRALVYGLPACLALFGCAKDRPARDANTRMDEDTTTITATPASAADVNTRSGESDPLSGAEGAPSRSDMGSGTGTTADAPATIPESEPAAGASSDTRSDVSATDQGENTTDLDITQRIRREVMQDDNLSFTAKNAKIVTRDGRVTLQGAVKSEAERRRIVAAAQKVAGAANVEDRLTVEK